jgi:trigger factor
MVLGDLIELDATDAIKPGGHMNRTTISLEYIKDDATRQRFVGRAAGDEVIVAADAIAENHDDLARMLNTDHEGVHHLAGNLMFRIAEIKRMQAVELGQDLFDRVYGKDAVTDEASFRAKVKEGLENMFRRDSDRMFKRLAMKKVQEKASIALPDGFLKRWIAMNSDKPMTDAELEAGYPGYAEGLKRQLVEDKVIEKYGLEAKGEELDAFAKRYIADQFGQYGMPAPEGEDLQRMAGRILGDHEQIKRMRDTIVEQKLTAHFKALLSPKEKKLSFDEFVNLARTA